MTQTPESAPREDPPPADALNALRVAKQARPGPSPAFAAPGENRPPGLEDLDEHLRSSGAPQARGVSPQGPPPQQPLAPPHEPAAAAAGSHARAAGRRRLSNSLRFRRKPQRRSNLAPLRRNNGPLQLNRRSLRSRSPLRALCQRRRQRRSMPRHLWHPRAQGPTLLRLPWREPRGSCSGGPNWARNRLSLFGSRRRRKGVNSARTSIRSRACALIRSTLGRTVLRTRKTHMLSPRRPLAHLGCEVVGDERLAAETPAGSSASLRSAIPTA